MKKFLAAMLACLMVLSVLAGCASQTAPETTATTEPVASTQTQTDAPAKQGDIAILYTNDVHTYIDGVLSYDVIAALKQALAEEYAYVLLADAGDHIQGTAYGSMDKGESIIKLMNAANYDVATLGNHEFDYGMDGAMHVMELAQYPYLSCNFYREENGVKGETVLPAYTIFSCGEEAVAFVGITTPESFTKSTPAYFQDEDGNYIYGISGGEDGAALYADVQKAIDDAKAAGATKVIALGHLGVDPSSTPWTSEETIAHISGLDAFIDGHSHTVMQGNTVTDLDGQGVLLTQTGEYFNRIGLMVISGETGEISTRFLEYSEVKDIVKDENGNAVLDEDGKEVTEVTGYALNYTLANGENWCSDDAVAEIKNDWIESIDEQLGTKIGTLNITLDNYSPDGSRLVRMKETVSGDFCADALYYLFDNMGLDVDVAVMNGGGIRNKTLTGDFTYKTAKEIHTFGNVACLQTITGQQLLDALEWGAREVGSAECGGFLQVAGITYTIDAFWAESTQKDDKGVWIGAPTGGYRVHDVKVFNKESGEYEALDLEKTYNLAGYNYTLRDLGDGFNMFDGAVNVLDYVMEDYMVLANYVQAFENGTVEATNSPLLQKYAGMKLDYGSTDGSSRITINTTN